jgi:leader peptidase (prepilin peptidase)/N-methyltransferase
VSWPALQPWLPVAAGAFGWVWGSFLNTIVDRTPRLDGTGPRLGWMTPARSVCLSCSAPVPWRDNIPIVSYLALQGRCRVCGAAIGRRTLAVEVVTPITFALAAVVLRTEDASLTTWFWTAVAASWAAIRLVGLLERRVSNYWHDISFLILSAICLASGFF